MHHKKTSSLEYDLLVWEGSRTKFTAVISYYVTRSCSRFLSHFLCTCPCSVEEKKIKSNQIMRKDMDRIGRGHVSWPSIFFSGQPTARFAHLSFLLAQALYIDLVLARPNKKRWLKPALKRII